MKVGRNVFCGLVSSFVYCLGNSISVHCGIVDDSLSGYDILLWGRGIPKDGSLEYTVTREIPTMSMVSSDHLRRVGIS